MPFLRRPRGSLSTPCAGLQPLQLHENRAIPEPWSLNEFAGEADQDRPRDGEHSRPHQQRAEVVVPRPMFYDICGCRSTAGTAGGGMREPMGRQARVVHLDEGKLRVQASPGERSDAPTVIGAGYARIFLPGKGKRPTIVLSRRA